MKAMEALFREPYDMHHHSLISYSACLQQVCDWETVIRLCSTCVQPHCTSILPSFTTFAPSPVCLSSKIFPSLINTTTIVVGSRDRAQCCFRKMPRLMSQKRNASSAHSPFDRIFSSSETPHIRRVLFRIGQRTAGVAVMRWFTPARERLTARVTRAAGLPCV